MKILDILRLNPVDLEHFIEETISDLVGLAKSFYTILDKAKQQNDDYSKRLYKLLVLLQPNIRIWHLIVAAHYKSFLNENLLKLIESMDIRIYKVRGTDPRKDIYMEVISELKQSNKFPFKSLCKFLQEYGNDSDFERYMRNKDMYKKEATKYILWEVNSELSQIAKQLGVNSASRQFNDNDVKLYSKLQIEHIIAQNLNANFGDFGFSNETEFKEYLNRIGNLTLLEENLNKSRRCSNKISMLKADKCYPDSQNPFTSSILVDYIRNKQGFSKSDIDKLTTIIINFCKRRFPICNSRRSF